MEKFFDVMIMSLVKAVICSIGVYLIWNGFMDVRFGLPHLSYFEAFVLCILGTLIAGT